MLPRVFSALMAAAFCFGCVESKPVDSSSSSTGEMPIPPPMKVVWTATSVTDSPSGRFGHSAVWTGSQMIIWGGNTGGMPFVTNTGALYDPTTDTWKAMSMTNAPTPRFLHVAAWTGSKMIVWGGFGTTDLEPAGGVYDPVTDSWSPMSTTNQSVLRSQPSGVWTGKKLVVWGGSIGSTPVATGGIYTPETDTWEVVNQAGVPSPRVSHSAAWSGKVMMVWGGNNFSDWLSSGSFFDPEGASSGVWTTTTASMGVPPGREKSSLEFVNSVFVMWGGWNGGPTVDTGGMLDPVKNAWLAMSTAGKPSARTNHASVAAGTHLLVWGGCLEHACEATDLTADGGQFVPDSMGGTWYPIDTQATLAARYSATAVYTGDGVIVWGGRLDPQTRTNTGAFAPL